jgi:hypothetical protein
MVYDLSPNNKELKVFRLSGWAHLLEQCGAYFSCMSQGARWYMLRDERMTTHYHDINDDGEAELIRDSDYPAIICNCGFEVTEEEAKVLARIARNYAAIQRTLPALTEEERGMPITTPSYLRPFPQPIRDDWVENFEQFAEWAEQSQGFKIF